jgi:type IV pilus biogenesis protein CpaD/CtpE
MKPSHVLTRAWIPILALLLAGCTQNRSVTTPTAPLSVKLGEPIVLAPGQSVTVGDEGLVIRFIEVSGDSRCPQGVECFWEGDAAARLTAKLPQGFVDDFTLHTARMFRIYQDYGDYRIRLTAVTPYPVYPDEIPAEDYRVTLEVTMP